MIDNGGRWANYSSRYAWAKGLHYEGSIPYPRYVSRDPRIERPARETAPEPFSSRAPESIKDGKRRRAHEALYSPGLVGAAVTRAPGILGSSTYVSQSCVNVARA
jgi:hypothetical protein